jgi:hypothetical protein
MVPKKLGVCCRPFCAILLEDWVVVMHWYRNEETDLMGRISLRAFR